MAAIITVGRYGKLNLRGNEVTGREVRDKPVTYCGNHQHRAHIRPMAALQRRGRFLAAIMARPSSNRAISLR